MFVFREPSAKQSLEGFTLIMPAVSVGNAGQLALDLLLNSTSPKPSKVALIDHPAFLPVVGSDPYDEQSSALTTQSEVFISVENKLVFIQLRSLTVKAHLHDFLTKLASWIQDEKLQRVILLSSFHAYERVDSQLEGIPFRFAASRAVPQQDVDSLKEYGWKELESRRTLSGEEKLIFPGGGFSGPFFRICNENGIPLHVLLVFCSEGDNIPDGLLLAGYFNQWVKVVAVNEGRPAWHYPISWKLFFGSPPPRTIY